MMERKGLQSTVEKIVVGSDVVARKVATEAGEDDLKQQIEFLSTLPISLQPHYPKLLSYNLSRMPYYYDMEYVGYPTMRNILLYSSNDAQFIKDRLDVVLGFIITIHHRWKTSTVPEGYIRVKYLDRAKRRIHSMMEKDAKFRSMMESTKVILGNEILPNAIALIEQMSKGNFISGVLTPSELVSTHGQLEFGHILVDEYQSSRFILIDPRGGNELLDSMYDFGKLVQCSHGYHDWLEEGQIELSPLTVKGKETIIEKFTLNLPSRVETARNVSIWLENRLTEILEMRADIVYKRLLFAGAMHLFGSIPFCYGFGDLDKAIACYISASRILKRLLEIYP